MLPRTLCKYVCVRVHAFVRACVRFKVVECECAAALCTSTSSVRVLQLRYECIRPWLGRHYVYHVRHTHGTAMRVLQLELRTCAVH